MEDFAGFSVRRTLGAGSIGTVQLVRDHASGRFAAVKRVPVERVPSEQAFRDRLALAARLAHPHVARQLDVRRTEYEWFVLSEFVPAGNVADLLARRGRLSVAELVTLLVPIARALAAAHRIGLCHGHLGPGDVLLTAEGRPILTDLGLHPGEADPQADLAALHRLALLAGGPATTFTAALFGLTSATKTEGEAERLAGRLLALADPVAIDLGFAESAQSPPAANPLTTSPAGESGSTGFASGVQAVTLSRGRALARPKRTKSRRASSARRRKSSRGWWSSRMPRPDTRVVMLGIAALFATALLITGVLLIGSEGGSSAAAEPPSPKNAATPTVSVSADPPALSPSSPTSTTAGPPVVGRDPGRAVAGWLATLRMLDRRRAEAFAVGDSSRLEAIYAPGSAPWQRDLALLDDYRRRGLLVQGLTMKIESVAIQREASTSAVLRVVDRLSAGVVLDHRGRRTVLPPGAPASRLITLTRFGKEWRIVSIVSA
ncbi:protein kinase domain-containing protein [Kribbella deserti]|uniref:Protein kinase n=1 Tax=Kribbella deserti TaxID=1926257 RepID=A0ABV6QUG3_9ACTN